MPSVIQRSLSAGELSPELYARVDTAKYMSGLRTMRNAWTKKSGGSQNRPGTTFNAESLNSANKCRLIPFVFSQEQAYLLEFSNGYFRAYQSGQVLLNYPGATSLQITGITNANPCIVTVNNSALIPETGEGFPFPEIYIQGAVGMTELNGRCFLATNISGNSFEITDINNNPIDSTSYGTYNSGGQVNPTSSGLLPYGTSNLSNIKFSQSGDVLTLTCTGYPVYQITRGSTGSGTTLAIGFTVAIANLGGEVANCVVGAQLSSVNAGDDTWRYCVTGVLENGEETTPLIVKQSANWTITGITKANPCVITITSSGTPVLYNGDQIYLAGIVGMTQLNGGYFNIASISGTTITIDVDATGYTAYSSGGEVMRASMASPEATTPTAANPNVIDGLYQPSNPFAAFAGGRITAWNIYVQANGIYAYLGTTSLYFFEDTGLEWDASIEPPVCNVFIDHNSLQIGSPPDIESVPSSCSYVQQRLCFANFSDNTQRVVGSQIGRYNCYNQGTPILDSDVVDFTIAGNKVGNVKFILELLDMIILTDASEFAALGDGSEVTPSDIGVKRMSNNGCSDLFPIVINNTAIYVQERGNVVRDFAWDWRVNGYTGVDLTPYAYHLFEGHTIVDWAYQQTPNSIVWAVRDDGQLLALTYVKEQEILAWHHHDFQGGTVENVCSIPEVNNGISEDAVYVVVNRTIQGVTKRYIERFNTRLVDADDDNDIIDAIFMDASLTYDGRNTNSGLKVTLTSSGTWTYNDTLTLTASSSLFTVSMVGDEIQLFATDTTVGSATYGTKVVIRFTIQAYSSGTVVTGRPNRTVNACFQSVAISDWAHAVDEVSGLNHLNGQTVSVFADGYVVASPNNPQFTNTITVSDGKITLPKCYGVIHVGLPFISDIETLDIDTPQGETIADRNKLTTGVTMFLDKTRGGFVGPKPPSSTAASVVDGLIEFKPRRLEPYDDPVNLKTGKYNLNIEPQWNSKGRVFIRQVDPLPISVLAIEASGDYPFRGP